MAKSKSKMKAKTTAKTKSNLKAKVKVKAKAKAQAQTKPRVKKTAQVKTAKAKKVVAQKSKPVVAKKISAKAKGSSVQPKSATKTTKSVKTQTKAKAAGPSKAAPQVNISEFVTPLDDRMIVQIQEPERMTAGGLYIPDSVSTEDAYVRGVVLAVGRGHRSDKGKIRPMDVQNGDRIMFAQHAGSKIKFQGQEFLIVRETDVLGIIG